MNEGPSKAWIAVAYLAFIGCEVLIGDLLAPILQGYVSHALTLRIEVILMLASFLAGGFVIGLASPRERLLEPGIAAALAVATTFLFAVFTPNAVYRFDTTKLAVASAIAFALALAGANAGENLQAKLAGAD